MVKRATLAVEGTEGLIVEYAKCCRPLPGDDIRGFVSAGRGLVIHRIDCASTGNRKSSAQEWMPLIWADTISGDFLAELRVQGSNRRGLLASIAAEIASAESSIENVHMGERVDNESTDLRFVITIKNRQHLSRVIRRIRRLGNVSKVNRI